MNRTSPIPSEAYELRDGALTVIVPAASDELDAVEQAVEADIVRDGDVVSVAVHDARPVGADGVDPEEPE